MSWAALSSTTEQTGKNIFTLIKQVCQKNVIFAAIGILKILVLNMESIFVMAAMI